jgi:prepilin-type N-terminal cleavage/methylation domain-containing protein
MSRQGAWEDERGFTLVEVLAVVIIMGIVFAIASSTWLRTIESRRVDSATNQVVADLRLAHTQATNRLTDSSFVVPSANSPTYQVGPAVDPDTRTLPDNEPGISQKTKIVDATNIVFKPNGAAEGPTPGGDTTITVAAANDENDPAHTIEINPVTSRVTICDELC